MQAAVNAEHCYEILSHPLRSFRDSRSSSLCKDDRPSLPGDDWNATDLDDAIAAAQTTVSTARGAGCGGQGRPPLTPLPPAAAHRGSHSFDGQSFDVPLAGLSARPNLERVSQAGYGDVACDSPVSEPGAASSEDRGSMLELAGGDATAAQFLIDGSGSDLVGLRNAECAHCADTPGMHTCSPQMWARNCAGSPRQDD